MDCASTADVAHHQLGPCAGGNRNAAGAAVDVLFDGCGIELTRRILARPDGIIRADDDIRTFRDHHGGDGVRRRGSLRSSQHERAYVAQGELVGDATAALGTRSCPLPSRLTGVGFAIAQCQVIGGVGKDQRLNIGNRQIIMNALVVSKRQRCRFLKRCNVRNSWYRRAEQ